MLGLRVFELNHASRQTTPTGTISTLIETRFCVPCVRQPCGRFGELAGRLRWFSRSKSKSFRSKWGIHSPGHFTRSLTTEFHQRPSRECSTVRLRLAIEMLFFGHLGHPISPDQFIHWRAPCPPPSLSRGRPCRITFVCRRRVCTRTASAQ